MSFDDRGLRERYPLFFIYGDEPKFLTKDEAIAATPEDRIQSVWPLMIGMILAFRKRLRPYESAQFNPEDMLMDIWIKVRERDHKWVPDRGEYTTFVGRIVRNALCDHRDTLSVVEGPRNSRCRLREYRDDDKQGRLSGQRRKTYGDILRLCSHFDEVEEQDHLDLCDPAAESIAREGRRLASEAVVEGFSALDTQESEVLGGSFGLWGQPVRTIGAIAREGRRSADTTRAIKCKALAKLYDRLLDLDHPVLDVICDEN